MVHTSMRLIRFIPYPTTLNEIHSDYRPGHLYRHLFPSSMCHVVSTSLKSHS
jgi:hypothetical protein